MPIGAAVGGAVIAGGATLGAGAMASNAQKNAAQQAADNSLQVATLNNQLARDVYNSNYGILYPYAQGGYGATSLINQMLGIPSPAATAAASGAASGQVGSPLGGGGPLGSGGSSLSQILAMQHDGIPGNFQPALSAYAAGNPSAAAGYNGPSLQAIMAMQHDGIEGNFAPALAAYQAAPTAAPTPAAATGTPAQQRQAARAATVPATGAGSAADAFAKFRQGTNYQWRLGQGQAALDQSYAGNGMFESGAADKARIEYGQNFASNELSNYMNLLGQQQSMGLNAAGAVAGVGNTFGQSVMGNNTNAGNAASNAALVAGQGQANMWGGVGQMGGQLGGALFNYGMNNIGGGGGGYMPNYQMPVSFGQAQPLQSVPWGIIA